MITIELFFKALPHIALLLAVILALRAETPDDLLKWQMWAILFTLTIIADRVTL